jgi:hypothetical protein
VTAPGAARRGRSRVYAAAVRRPGLLLATLVASIAIAGCGGGGSTKIDSKADFIKAGDKICTDRDKDSAKFVNSLGKEAQVAQLSGGLADIYAKTIAKVQALELPPGAARAGAQAYVQAVAAQAKPVQRMKAAAAVLGKAVASKDLDAVKKTGQQLQIHVNTVQVLGDVADQKARDYGFAHCGQEPLKSPVS